MIEKKTVKLKYVTKNPDIGRGGIWLFYQIRLKENSKFKKKQDIKKMKNKKKAENIKEPRSVMVEEENKNNIVCEQNKWTMKEKEEMEEKKQKRNKNKWTRNLYYYLLCTEKELI